MASIHVWKAIKAARAKGGSAGLEQNLPLWEMSKRELVEALLHLSALAVQCEPTAPEATARAIAEIEALHQNGIL